MVVFQGRGVERAPEPRTAEPGHPVSCVRCERELVVPDVVTVPVVCGRCYDEILALRAASLQTGFRFGV